MMSSEYFNPTTANCIFCYSCFNYNNDYANDQQTVRLNLSIISSSLKHIPQDITGPVNWNEHDLNNSLHFCKTCKGTLVDLSKLNSEFEEIKRKISELVNIISFHVRNERGKYGHIPGQSVVSSFNTNAFIVEGPAPKQTHQLRKAVRKSKEKNLSVAFEEKEVLDNDSHHNNTDAVQSDKNENVTKSDTNNVSVNIPLSSQIECAKQTEPKSSLQKLLDSTSGYECSTCNKKFSRYAVLQKHDCGKPTVECEICGCSFSSSGVLKLHTRSHTGEKPFKCDICEKAFSTRGNLRTHIQGMHNSQDKTFECEICGKKFAYGVALSKHKITHNEEGEKLYKCDVCGKSFKELKPLKLHLVTHSTGTTHPFKCDLCEKTFARPLLVVHHKKRVHFGESTVTCEICGKSISKDAMKKHKMVHSGEKPFQCSHCEKSYRSSLELQNHEWVHKEEAAFPCDLCGKVCKTPKLLKAHARFHQDKVTCEICGKSLTRNALAVHKKSHTNPKSFKCDLCDKRFSFRKSLKVHVNRFCHICNIFLPRKLSGEGLTRHQVEVHTVQTILYPEENLTDDDEPIKKKSKRNIVTRRTGKRNSSKMNYKESSSEDDDTSSGNSYDEDEINDLNLKVEVKVEDEFSDIEDSEFECT